MTMYNDACVNETEPEKCAIKNEPDLTSTRSGMQS